jgi:hypothetical protein
MPARGVFEQRRSVVHRDHRARVSEFVAFLRPGELSGRHPFDLPGHRRIPFDAHCFDPVGLPTIRPHLAQDA